MKHKYVKMLNVLWRKFSFHCKNFHILKYSGHFFFRTCLCSTQDLFLLINFLLANSLNSQWKFRLWVGKKRRGELQLSFSQFVYVCAHVQWRWWVAIPLDSHSPCSVSSGIPNCAETSKSLSNMKNIHICLQVHS